MGILFGVSLYVLLLSSAVYAHGGGLDAQGGHHNRSTGTYHFHRGPLKGQSFSNKAAATSALTGGRRTTSRPSATPGPAESIQPVRNDSTLIESMVATNQEWQGAEVAGVSYVVDGDTVALTTKGGGLAKVRLIGVDTPETVHPSKPVEYYGREASLFLTNLLKGERVFVVYGQERTDKFGRVLAYLYRYPDGLFVNGEIIRQGYGFSYVKYPHRHMELFNAYQGMARTAGRGLWRQ